MAPLTASDVAAAAESALAVGERGEQSAAQDALDDLCARTSDSPAATVERLIAILSEPKASTYGGSLARARELLVHAREREGDAAGAAEALELVPVGAGDGPRLANAVRFATLYLAAGEADRAAPHLTKASLLAPEAAPARLQRAYGLAQARLAAIRGRHADAAARYHTLAQRAGTDKHDSRCLYDAALGSAILASPDAARSRIVAALAADPSTGHDSLVAKLARLRALTSDDVLVVASALQDVPADAWSDALARHNLAAAAELYDVVPFARLGTLTGRSSSEAEKLARTMVQDGSLSVRLDNVDGVMMRAVDRRGALPGDADGSLRALLVRTQAVADRISGRS